ncbi:TnsA-like heteromeric transposase endonuclease subunit [Streptomyces sp. NPDC052016]|uniref:TnsA-like heteromeric transposase endonuclease subunit n=1 Tax=Streptomyces sp. NPDC052016 TaxID=3365680 RepID=UPI0037CF5056
MDSLAATVSVRQTSGQLLEDLEWSAVSIDMLRTAAPWRTFRWRKEQRHYSGTYWSATTGDHVIYESRLELARLLCADFDPLVHGIVAQPFLLKTVAGARIRKYIPDYLLITDHGPVVVDVKPRRRWSDPVVSFTFAWARQVVEARGWGYGGVGHTAAGRVGEHPFPCWLPPPVAVRAGHRGGTAPCRLRPRSAGAHGIATATSARAAGTRRGPSPVVVP